MSYDYDSMMVGNEWQIRCELGVPLPSEHLREEPPERSPEERFREHRASLIRTLESSPYLEQLFTQTWTILLKGISINRPSSRSVLYEFMTAYDRFYQDAKSRFGGMRFTEEVYQIVWDARKLWALLSD